MDKIRFCICGLATCTILVSVGFLMVFILVNVLTGCNNWNDKTRCVSLSDIMQVADVGN